MGKHEWNKLTDQQKEAWRRNPPIDECYASDVEPASDLHLQALLGARRLQLRTGSVRTLTGRHKRLKRHVLDFERQHGSDAQVRLATNFVFEARDESGISFAEIAVLSGIYSKVGAAKTPVRITRQEIRRRAHGCKSKKVFHVQRSSRGVFLSERQTRSIIDRLHERGFFARITFARRQTYYSHRLTADQLAEAIFQLKTRGAKTRHTRIQANNDLTSRIRAERIRLADPGSAEAT